MSKKVVFLWLIFFCVWLLLMFSLFSYEVKAQGLTSADIYRSFKSKMQNDNLTFPDSVIYQCINLATAISCVSGFSYPKVDTIVLSTGTERYGLNKLAVWVYRIGKIGEGERSWQSVVFGDMGKYQMGEALNPAYWDFTTEMEGVTSTFSAGKDTSYVYVFPKPTVAENNDSITVHYFAWADTLDGVIKNNYREPILQLALMGGFIRARSSDRAILAFNKAMPILNKLRNDQLGRIRNIEVNPTDVGGR